MKVQKYANLGHNDRLSSSPTPNCPLVDRPVGSDSIAFGTRAVSSLAILGGEVARGHLMVFSKIFSSFVGITEKGILNKSREF